jgi:Tol biopolymer transport system component
MTESQTSASHLAILEVFSRNGVDASLTHDGSYIVYTDLDAGDIPLLLDRRTGDKDPLPDGLYAPRIDPSGQWLVSGTPEGGFVISTLDGEQVREIYGAVEGARPRFLDWSNDSARILIALTTAKGSELAVIEVASGLRQSIKSLPFGDGAFYMSAAFSPDGRQIAYDGPVGLEARWHIVIMNQEGTAERTITSGQHNEFLLGWWPDPLGLVIASDASGVWEALLLEQEEDGNFIQKQLLARDLGAVWQRQSNSQQGHYLFATCGWENNLYLIELDSPETQAPVTKLADDLAWESRAEWLPGGEAILYGTGSGTGADRFRLRRWLNGQAETVVDLSGMLRFGGHAFEPRLSQDGATLAFQARSSIGGLLDSEGIYRLDWPESRVKLVQQTEGFCPMGCLEWPTWLDSSWLAYTRWKNPWPSRHVIRRNLATGVEETLFETKGIGIAHLEGAAGSQQLAWVAWDPRTGQGQVQWLDLPTRVVTTLLDLERPVLTGYGQPLVALAWSSDATTLYCAESRSAEGNPSIQVWSILINGAQKQPIIHLEGLAPFGLSMNPDGCRLLLSAGSQAEYQLRLLHLRRHSLPETQ